MSKFTVTAATNHALTLAAAEEASRVGQRAADLEHLLLALVVSEQIAGQVLRSFGITLATARAAVTAQHADQLAVLGVRTDLAPDGPITAHETGRYEWSRAASEVLNRSTRGDRQGDAAAVLRELLDEPSGLIEAVLGRLGATPDAIAERLDEIERLPNRPQHFSNPRDLTGISEVFVPAVVEEVWALLADPTRMPEWEPGTGRVESAPAETEPGATWITHARTELPDGKALRSRPGYDTWRVHVTACEEPRLVEWEFWWPDAPNSNRRRLRIELEPAAGGTQLQMSTTWVRDPARRRRWLRPVRRIMRPLHRYAIWQQLTELGASIGRVFR